MTLREAAQALAKADDAVENDESVDAAARMARSLRLDAAWVTFRAALAAPPEPGWAEGYRAGLEAAERLAKDWNAAGYPIGCAISQIPIPSAPAPEAPKPDSREVCERLLGAVGVVGALEKKTNAEIGKLLLDHVWAHEEELGSGRELLLSEAISRLAPGLDSETTAAPEAKPAESEVFWVIAHRWEGRPSRLRDDVGEDLNPNGEEVKRLCREWNGSPRHSAKHEYVPLRLRVTVEPEPSPVEPEETQR